MLSLAGRHAASALVGCCCAGAWPQLCPADGAWAVSATERELLCAAADDEPAAAATAVAARRVVGALRVEAARRRRPAAEVRLLEMPGARYAALAIRVEEV